jgi:uncharacterized membrane protein YdfJ with MMPL/SSD domain
MFIPIVIGVGIDYGNYYLFRYEEEMLLGRKVREALERTGGRTGPGMLLGALTAAGTFLVLLLTDFRGIQELGLIAGISILLAWLGMMTLLPALLVLVDLRHAAEPRDREVRADLLKRIRVPVLDHLTGYSKTILVAAAIATALSAWAVRRSASTTTCFTSTRRARSRWPGRSASSRPPAGPASTLCPPRRPSTSCAASRRPSSASPRSRRWTPCSG